MYLTEDPTIFAARSTGSRCSTGFGFVEQKHAQVTIALYYSSQDITVEYGDRVACILRTANAVQPVHRYARQSPPQALVLLLSRRSFRKMKQAFGI